MALPQPSITFCMSLRRAVSILEMLWAHYNAPETLIHLHIPVAEMKLYTNISLNEPQQVDEGHWWKEKCAHLAQAHKAVSLLTTTDHYYHHCHHSAQEAMKKTWFKSAWLSVTETELHLRLPNYQNLVSFYHVT